MNEPSCLATLLLTGALSLPATSMARSSTPTRTSPSKPSTADASRMVRNRDKRVTTRATWPTSAASASSRTCPPLRGNPPRISPGLRVQEPGESDDPACSRVRRAYARECGMRRRLHLSAGSGMKIATKRIVAPLHNAAATPGAAGLYGRFDLQQTGGAMKRSAPGKRTSRLTATRTEDARCTRSP